MADSLEQNKEVLLTRVVPLIGVTFVLLTAYFTYSQYSLVRSSQEQQAKDVLGEKSAGEVVTASVCNSNEALAAKLQEKNVVIPLLAPDKQEVFNVSEVAPCMVFPSCESATNCGSVEVQVDRECLSSHFTSVPLDLTDEIEIVGEAKTVVVRKQDWVVSNADLVSKIANIIESEVSYCDVKGEISNGKSKLSVLTVPVTDILPSAPKTFATRFLEIDNSKEKAYYWVNGSYQEFRMLRGSEAGQNRIAKRSTFDFTKLFAARDAEYLAKNILGADLVIVHE